MAFSLEEGHGTVSLSRILALGRLPPAAAVVASRDVLRSVASLHSTGRAHGRLTSALVRVSEDGTVAVDPPPFHDDVPATGADIAADARACGELVCQVLAVPVRPAGRVVDPAEAYFPRLIALARGMADGSAGTDVGRLAGEFEEAAGAWLLEDRVEAGRALLGRAASRAERGVPPVELRTPEAAPPASGRGPVIRNWLAEPGRSRMPELSRGAWVTLAAIAVIVVAALLAAPRIASRLQAATPATPVHSPAPSTAATPKPGTSPTATPAPRPSVPPTSAGVIRSVELTPQGSCAPGSPCGVEVSVHFAPAPAPQVISWTFRAIDACTGASSDLGGSQVNAQAGWNNVIGDSTVTLPQGRKLNLYAITVNPDAASSAPLTTGPGC